MAFPWFRQPRGSASGVVPATDVSPTALLHARIRASLGNPGPHLCRPQHGCGALAGPPGRRIAAFVFGDAQPHATRLDLAPADGDENYLLMHDQRGVEADVVAYGLLPKAVCEDPWRLWIVLQRLFDANDRLSTPVLPAVPQFVAAGSLLREDHLRQLCWAALRNLPDARTAAGNAGKPSAGGRLGEEEFAALWSRITGGAAQALHGRQVEQPPV